MASFGSGIGYYDFWTGRNENVEKNGDVFCDEMFSFYFFLSPSLIKAAFLCAAKAIACCHPSRFNTLNNNSRRDVLM